MLGLRQRDDLFSLLERKMIYFDHSATSWPKPPEVKAAILRFLEDVGASPGRSGHLLSIEAARIIYEAREAVAAQVKARDPLRVIFTHNATESINLALKGLLRPGQHIITSSIEHNSVMRPLRDLERHGIAVSIAPCDRKGLLDPAEIKKRVQPNTRMIVLSHASNVLGTLLPIREVGRIARERNILFLVDAAQTAGAYPIHVEEDSIDLLAFTGHKSLYGPQGTGGLVIGEEVNEQEILPLKRGGTGSRSEFEEQPDFLPDRLESGTPNAVGIAGLLAGLQFLSHRGVEAIREHEMALTQKLIDGLKPISGVNVYGPVEREKRIATVSFNLEGVKPSEAALRLEKRFGILCRPGLHCAPSAHRTLGTFPDGTVRFSLGFFNTEQEVMVALQGVSELSRPSS